jgi:hypothetical protein
MNTRDYQQNEIAYCVNYKGQKVKPYKSRPQPKKQTILQKLINLITK